MRPAVVPHDPARAAALVDALAIDAAETDREGGYPHASIALLTREGFLRASASVANVRTPQARREHASGVLNMLATVGRGSLVAGRLLEGHVNALQLIDRYGGEGLRTRAFRDADEGHLFAVWNTQADDGVTATRAREGYLIHGSKTFASGLGHVSRAIVTVAMDDGDARGVQMVLVATDEHRPCEDRSFWKPLGMRASSSFRADFTGLVVTDDALVGGPGDYYHEPAFSGGAIRFVAVQLGGAEAVFDETRRFLRKLGRTADPHQRARLGEMAWRVEGGRLWLEGAARHAGDALTCPRDVASTVCSGLETSGIVGTDAGRRSATYAHLMRSAIEQTCLRVLELAERSVGARGLLRPEPFERLHRDLTHYLRQPAPDAALVAAGGYALEDPRPADQLWS